MKSVLEKALNLMKDKKYKDALGILSDEVDKKHNRDPKLAILAGNCCDALGDIPKRDKYYCKASAMKPVDNNIDFIRETKELGLVLNAKSHERISLESLSLTAYSSACTFRQGIKEGI